MSNIKFETKINREELHLITKLDEEMFFNNAKEIYIERPSGEWAGEKPGNNPSLGIWLSTGETGVDKLEPVYIVFEFEDYGFTKFKNVYIARHLRKGARERQNFSEVYKHDINDLRKNGYNLQSEYDYNTVAKFLNDKLYHLYFKEFEEAGYKDSMFAGWGVLKSCAD